MCIDYTTSKKYLFLGTIYSLWACNSACIEKDKQEIIAFELTLATHDSQTSIGLQAERCLHSDSGSTEEHSGGLLEDDVGVPVWLYCDALSAGGRWPGE